MEMPPKSVQWTVLMLPSATAEFLGSCPALIAPTPCLTCISSNSHGIRYTPRALNSKTFLDRPQHPSGMHCGIYLYIFLILCFFRSLPILLLMAWCNGIRAVPEGCVFCRRASPISQWLSVVSEDCWRCRGFLSASHSTQAQRTGVAATSRFCAGVVLNP